MSAYLNNNHNIDRRKDDKRKDFKSSRIITNHRGNGSAEHMVNGLE